MSDISATPLVTVYMTVKNGLPFIRQAIDSILHQSYVNWEAVIVDDGSSDGTDAWLRDLSLGDTRFNVVLTSGVGRAAALNLALGKARGEWVANLDADDIFHPKKLEIQIACLVANPEIEFLCSLGKEFREEIPFLHLPDPIPEPVDVSRAMAIQNRVGHSSVMICRKSLMKVGGYNEERTMQVDLDLWYRLLLSGVKIYMHKFTLRGKRVHDRQSYENKKRYRYIYSSYLLRKSYLNQTGGNPTERLLSTVVFVCGFIPPKFRQKFREIRNLKLRG